MLRSTPPRGQARAGGLRGAVLFPSRSQPDLTLVGVKSVLSPRPFSAPHATPRGLRGTRHPFHFSCYSDGPSRGSSQAGASDTLSEAQESEYTGHEDEESANSQTSDGQTGAAKHAIPGALLGLHAQASRDSALGSSIDGAPRHPPDDANDQDLPLDTPRTTGDVEEGKEEEEEDSNRDEDQGTGEKEDEKKDMKEGDKNVQDSADEEQNDLEVEKGHHEERDTEGEEKDVLGTPQPKEPDKDKEGQNAEQGREKGPEQVSKHCEGEAENTDEGTDEDASVTKSEKSPLHPARQTNPKNNPDKRRQQLKPYSRFRVPKDRETATTKPTKTLTCAPLRPIPVTSLTPPPVTVTPDPDPGAVDDLDASKVDVQEVIDVRLAEAHGTGHLNLSNLGLPFFPSAVLLADASMIHRVSLQDNRLVELPAASLSQLTHVTWLDLRYNLLTYLPQEISALVSLQVLLLQGNRLTALPTSLGTLPALVTLQVSDNPLTFPPEAVIRGGARSILQFLREVCTATTNTTTTCTTSSCESDFSTSTPVKIPVSIWESTGGQVRHEHLIYDENVISSVEDEGETSEGEGSDGEGSGDVFRGTLVAAVGEGDTGSSGDIGARAGYLECPPSPMPSLRVAIRTSREETSPHHHHHQHPKEGLCLPLHSHIPDSDGDTLAPPVSPVSPCLLTPNTDLPTRTTFDLTREGLEAYERELVMSLGLTGDMDLEALLGLSRDSMEVLDRVPDGEVKEHLLRCLSQRNAITEHFDGSAPEFEGRFAGQPRRALHLHLQADYQQQYFEDDSESLQGDLGEGYRRPQSQVVEDEGECQRKVSPLPLPVVSLQLPASGEAWSGEEELEEEDGRRAGGGGRRRTHGAGRRIKRGSKLLHKPKLATVAEVHRRAREERRRQREMLAAAREMTEQQRLKSQEGLEAWRDEARLLQEQCTLSPEGYLPAVCEAPFAVDGTMLTPRARSRLRSSGGVRSSLSPSVSEVCAGVRSCLDELNRTKTCSERRRGDGGAGGGGGKGEDVEGGDDGEGRKAGGKAGGGGGGAGGGRVVGGSLAHPAAIVHQLHHLRRQLHRLKVNCVI